MWYVVWMQDMLIYIVVAIFVYQIQCVYIFNVFVLHIYIFESIQPLLLFVCLFTCWLFVYFYCNIHSCCMGLALTTHGGFVIWLHTVKWNEQSEWCARCQLVHLCICPITLPEGKVRYNCILCDRLCECMVS